MTPIEDSDLHRLTTILAESSELSNDRVKFCMGLEFSSAKTREMNAHNRLYYEGKNYDFFSSALSAWIENKGRSVATFENLVRILEEEEFRGTADKVRDEFLRAERTFANPNTARPRVDDPVNANATVSFDLHKKQRDFVTSKLVELVQFNRDWEMMVIHLASTGLATPNTIQILVRKIQNKKSNDAEKFYAMYQEVTSRLDFFEKLKKCLRGTNNTDALSILNEFVP